MTATAVLVHGAWHGAWCFDRVMPLLERAGVPAIAVDLPGHGRDAGPLTDLHGDADRVREVLDGIDGDVVLLGHSYGGAVVTEAGVHPAVAHVVYLCAVVPDADESAASVAMENSAGLSYDGRPEFAGVTSTNDDGTLSLNPSRAPVLLYNDCDPQTVEWAVGELSPQPMENLAQNPAAVAWRERPSTYVVCTDDMIVHPGLQEILARRCTGSREWPTSHSPFLSRPELVADLIVELATQPAS
ncbi:MAG: putative esterase [Actinomycetia bacterium]|nr:putative esterase [Actinomycetes bacterium]